MNTEELVLAADRGTKPEWGRNTDNPSALVETARGEMALRAAARVLDEHAAKTNRRVVEVARVVTRDGKYEAVYARCEPLAAPPLPDANADALAELADDVDKMTRNLSQAVTGIKP